MFFASCDIDCCERQGECSDCKETLKRAFVFDLPYERISRLKQNYEKASSQLQRALLKLPENFQSHLFVCGVKIDRNPNNCD